MPRRNTVDDFWNNIDTSSGPDGCWPWKRSRSKSGYGKTFFKGKDWRAHRLAFFLSFGRAPPAVCHKCDNPPCCNPSHLFAGDNTINTLDRTLKGRSARQKGDTHGMSKVTSEIVMDIRLRYASGSATQNQLAFEYSIHRNHVSDIVRGKRWPHLPLVQK